MTEFNPALILPLLASVTTVAAQLFYKKSALQKQSERGENRWIITLFSGNVLFLSAIVCNFIAMKFIALFVVYAFTALNYVFVTFASGMVIKERIKGNNILASIIIAVGVFLITMKSGPP